MNDYIVNAFTKTEDNINLEVDNLNVGCITSKNNNFNLDSDGNLTVKSINTQQELMSQETIRNFIYPIGSVYMNVNDTSPATLFGGTWVQLPDRFLLGAGTSYLAGSIGGEATHLLSETEIPWHYHPFSGYTGTAGSHIHTGNTLELRQTNSYNYTNDAARPIGSSYSYAGVTIVNPNGDHNHTFSGSTSGIGGSGAHNNMPPYLVVYMWKRTA